MTIKYTFPNGKVTEYSGVSQKAVNNLITYISNSRAFEPATYGIKIVVTND